MKLLKTVLSLTLSVVFLLGLFPASFAAGVFTDSAEHWAGAAISRWSDCGIILGSGGLFRPNDPITRAELAAILNRVMIYQQIADNTFTDLPEKWYTKDILALNAADVLQGANGKVRPEDNITREEAAVMFGRAFSVDEGKGASTRFSDTGTISSWAQPLVFGMEAKGYVSGSSGQFRPRDHISRAEVVKILDNLIDVYITEAGEKTGDVEGNVLINTTGVTLKNMSIAGDLYLTDGIAEGDVNLDSVTVKGKAVVHGDGMDSINISGKSGFTVLEICKPSGPVHIRVTGDAVQFFLDLGKIDGLTVTEDKAGELDVIVNGNMLLSPKTEETPESKPPLAAPTGGGSGGGGSGGGGSDGGGSGGGGSGGSDSSKQKLISPQNIVVSFAYGWPDVCWDKVPNAKGYRLTLTDSEGTDVSVDVDDPDAASHSFKSVVAYKDVSYAVSVVALSGESSLYADSEAATASKYCYGRMLVVYPVPRANIDITADGIISASWSAAKDYQSFYLVEITGPEYQLGDEPLYSVFTSDLSVICPIKADVYGTYTVSVVLFAGESGAINSFPFVDTFFWWARAKLEINYYLGDVAGDPLYTHPGTAYIGASWDPPGHSLEQLKTMGYVTQQQLGEYDNEGIQKNKTSDYILPDGPEGQVNNKVDIVFPFLVNNVNDMRKVGSGDHGMTLTAFYLLTNDLTLNNWIVIGRNEGEDPFIGSFDGDGHTVTINSIAGSPQYAGLFGYIGRGGLVKNVKVAGDFSIVGGSIENYAYIGGIAGRNMQGHIVSCAVSANITLSGTATYSQAGGIAGENSNGLIENSYSTGNISATSNGYNKAGGITGVNGNGTLINCYASGVVTSASNISNDVGGIIGENIGETYGCVALNADIISASSGFDSVGRITGYARGGWALTNSRAIAIGAMTETGVSDEAPDEAGPVHGLLIALAEAKRRHTYELIGWKFGVSEPSPWSIDEDHAYPILWWEK
jgi:hypothetical protein